MEPQDDYMTTNRLLDQLAISIQKDAAQKSEQFLISSDLLNKISNQLNLQKDNANTLVSQLLNSYVKKTNLLKASNEKNKNLQLDINKLQQRLKILNDKLITQSVNNSNLNIKLQQMQHFQNSYKSMQKSLSTFQTSYQQSQKKQLSLKQQNQRLNQLIKQFKTNFKNKISQLVPKFRKQFQDLKMYEINKKEQFSKSIHDLSNKLIEFISNKGNKNKFDENTKEKSHIITQKQYNQQYIQQKSKPLDQLHISLHNCSQQMQNIPNQQHIIKPFENQKQDYQIQKLNASSVENIKKDNNLKKQSIHEIQIHYITQDNLLQLQKYIFNSLDPQLQSCKIKLKTSQDSIKAIQQCIQKLTNYITKYLLSPYSNKQTIQNILTEIVKNINSNQQIVNCLKSLNNIEPSIEYKKEIVHYANSGYLLNEI